MFRKDKVSMLFATNDRWLNSHSHLAWGANLDMSILIDEDDCVAYVAKYCSKTQKSYEVMQLIYYLL